MTERNLRKTRIGVVSGNKMDKTITVTGTVTEFDFSFPHPSLFFDVKDEKGQVVKWGSEFLPTPPAMRKR